jgi:hypothetical protein
VIDPRRVLIRHPATPAPMVRAVEADAVWLAGGTVAFRYRLRADMARLRIPAEGAAPGDDPLWAHTCFEAFVAPADEAGYREFNFSPSGRWAVYDFGGYRQRLAEPLLPAPRIAARATEGRLELEALVPAAALPPPAPGGAWDIGLSAIVETADAVADSHSHWALHHPSPRPDFHRREAFTLRLLAGRED